MAVTADDIKKLGTLARIHLEEGPHCDMYQKGLTRLLTLIEKMDTIDTSQTTAMAHPLDVYQRTRPDEVTEPDIRDTVQKLAPNPKAVEAGLYLVPRVIEDNQ
ncbi:MAG: Asp-tRNA(Asn)/Glu-tRNA(Gln) amidotransferase subunit GatC [Gammaproteobacteria bacterium]